MQINQRLGLYLLSQLKLQGLNIQALHTLFTGLITPKILACAMPAFAGQLTTDTGWAPSAIITKGFTTRCLT